MPITEVTNELKERMLERLDPTKTTVDIGLAQVFLLKRNSAGDDTEKYNADGIYGGGKTIAWESIITSGILKQDGSVHFYVEQGVHIEGYELIFRVGEVYNRGGLIDTETFYFEEDGTFTISNIQITVGE